MKVQLAPLALFLFTILSVSNSLRAQDITKSSLWYGYFFTIPVDQNWYTVTEIQERHFVAPFSQNQFLVRTRLHRTWGKNWDASTGFSLFLNHREGSSENDNFNWPELRPHLDITLKSQINRITMEQRTRVEARFFQNLDPTSDGLAEGFFFRTFRFRYRLQGTIPIAKIKGEKPLKLKIADEIMGQAGGELENLTFDQNRISADVSFDLFPNFQVEMGYVFWHQAIPSGGYLDQHIFRTYLRHRIDLSRK